ncbi:uncharacterized protein LOC125659736 [Ostrea edulis]|uniref:uncharacterized protein LOC125659736 n=1 Tax=Ostrea edulis TaxID=37623 RepID=UPI002095E5E7|nr:uncharacterized protein LOC125659736 [Ostrea edulis]
MFSILKGPSLYKKLPGKERVSDCPSNNHRDKMNFCILLAVFGFAFTSTISEEKLLDDLREEMQKAKTSALEKWFNGGVKKYKNEIDPFPKYGYSNYPYYFPKREQTAQNGVMPRYMGEKQRKYNRKRWLYIRHRSLPLHEEKFKDAGGKHQEQKRRTKQKRRPRH